MLPQPTKIPDTWDRNGLPGWCYFSEQMFRLECDTVFRTHWQYVCHVNEVSGPGDYMTLDIAGERGMVIRGHDGTLRAFHNLCRHRGSRVVGDARGTCNKALICPYHGWAYNLDGSLRGVARPETFPEMNPSEWGLKPLEMEIWQGFVFVRFAPGPQPALRDIFARFDDIVSRYNVPDLVACDSNDMHDMLDVNWKAVRDVDNEGYHVRQAHPGLQDLYGLDYFDDPYTDYVSWSVGRFNPGPSRRWSTRHYRKLLPQVDLPDGLDQGWLYIGLFPNLVFGFYPDSVIYYQELPQSANSTLQRSRAFRRAEESREMAAARYLSGRIDRDTGQEDHLLTVWACEATRSSAYDGIMLSDLEYGLKTHHDHLRDLMPVMRQAQEPANLPAENAKLLERA